MSRRLKLVGATVAAVAAVVLSGRIGARGNACSKVMVGSCNVWNSNGDQKMRNRWEAHKAVWTDLGKKPDLGVGVRLKPTDFSHNKCIMGVEKT